MAEEFARTKGLIKYCGRIVSPAKKEGEMADVIKFEDKKSDDDDDAILESLLEPEGSDDIGKGDTGGGPEKDNLIHMPSKSWPPIDWDEIEAIRKAEYPRIPKKALAIIRKMFENPRDDCYFDIQNFEGEGYPPDPVPIRPILGDAIWIMDLLDRFGGEIRWGNHQCIVKRKKKKAALFLIQPISRITRDALIEEAGIGSMFEHFLQSKSWTIWAKEITDKMMILIINNRQNEDRIYVGWFDRRTAWVIFRRMNDLSIERVLGLE